jgi:DMSO/TMAO reductase YedYZ molybdopterin-dependent catalytic subunit
MDVPANTPHEPATGSDDTPTEGHRSRHPRGRLARAATGAVIGLTAAATGLATAELVAAFVERWQSPVLDVGDRVVDGAPRWLKDLAIDWFGTGDKTALLIGIATILTAYAALVGVLALGRRAAPTLVGIGLFGLVGAWASQTTRRAAPLSAVVPSLLGAIVAAGTILLLRRVLRGTTPTALAGRSGAAVEPARPDRAPAPPTPSIAELTPSGRRRFLATAGLAAVGAVVVGASGRRLASTSGAATSRTALTLPRPDRALAPAPAGITAPVRGLEPFFTPNRDFYRIDTALTVPQVPADSWRLRIGGMVDRPLELGFEDLLRRELVEADITLTCVSNEVGGRLVGTARWLGVRLDRLLEEVGVDPAADQIVGRSVDGYTAGFPVAALDGRDALVAIGMNGEPLPLEHGFPARLIVPGLYGYVSATKWLSEIELTTFDAFDQYWVARGWAEQAPIKVQSRIDTPRGLDTVAAGTVAVGGVAWAQTRGIERVEIQVDEGPWEEATLAEELNDVTWRQWSYAWVATPGRHTLTVRATERNGPIQTPERSEPFPSGATGQHRIVVIVD